MKEIAITIAVVAAAAFISLIAYAMKIDAVASWLIRKLKRWSLR